MWNAIILWIVKNGGIYKYPKGFSFKIGMECNYKNVNELREKIQNKAIITVMNNIINNNIFTRLQNTFKSTIFVSKANVIIKKTCYTRKCIVHQTGNMVELHST